MTDAAGGDWLIYAAGGGWGHLVRALSLARAAAKKYRIKILANSPYLRQITESAGWQQDEFSRKIEIINSNEFFAYGSKKESFRGLVHSELRKKNYSCLVVDSFARGLMGELPELLKELNPRILKVMVQRDINPDYARKYALGEFIDRNYDLIINPGEDHLEIQTEKKVFKTSAFLIRDAHEIRDRTELRKELGLHSQSEKLVLICACGKPEELETFAKLKQKLAGDFQSLKLLLLGATQNSAGFKASILQQAGVLSYFPGIDLVNAADLVISSAGYNISNECKALLTPLAALPQNRLYDRQALRIDPDSGIYEFTAYDELTRLLKKLLYTAQPEEYRSEPSFKNGALEAFEFIETCFYQKASHFPSLPIKS